MFSRNATHGHDTFGPVANAAGVNAHGARVAAADGSEELPPEVIEHLEQLDDVIFAAIDGDQAALQESAAAWHRAVRSLGHDTVEETRRQYLRHAQSVWESLRHQSVQPPHKIFAAIEIIGLLVNSER
jgi:hypothetical protein